jgi:hypothetical protein
MKRMKFKPIRPLSWDDVAKSMHVPYWLIDPSRPKPSWREHPIWRLRAAVWCVTDTLAWFWHVTLGVSVRRD